MLIGAGSLEQVGIILLVIFVAGLLARSDRRSLAGVTFLYLLALALQHFAAVVLSYGRGELAKTLDFFGLLLLGVALLNLAATLLFSIALRFARLEPPRIIRDLGMAFAYLAFAFFLFSHYHVDLTGIIATSAVITAVIGFSLQDILANVMGGIALQIDDSISPGDWVRYGDLSGVVREISWRRVSIETRNGDLVLVPNSLIMKNQVILVGHLWNGERRQRRWVYFDVDARHTPSRVMEVVAEALNRDKIAGVASEPAPHVVLMELRDGLGHYAVRYWLTDIVADDSTDSAIRTRLFYALERAGVPPGVPQSSILLHRGQMLTVEKTEPPISERLTALKTVSIFSSLTSEELQRVAGQLIWAPFAPGEAIIIQGAGAHYLYILTRGRVEVRLTRGGASLPVAQMEAPNFFGEGGMLTGAARSATIVALTEAECWRLHKEGFEEVIRSRPQIAEEISDILAMRRVELAAVSEDLSEEAKRQRMEAERRTLVTRIRKFFSI